MVLPLIFGALGGALGGAGMLGGLGALGGAAVGSGLGGFAETGDLETGILTGLGAFAGGSLLGPLMGGAGAAGAGATGAAGTAAGTGAAGAAGATGAGLGAAAVPGGLGAAALPMKANLATIGSAAAPMNAVANPGVMGIGRGAMDFMKTGAGMGVGVGSMMGGALAPMFSKGEKEERYGSGEKEMQAIPRDVQFAPDSYRPGMDGEFNYGLGAVPSSGQVLGFRDYGVNPYRMAGGGMIRSLERTFGPIRLAEGGIATLIEGADEGQVPSAPTGGGNEKDVVVEAVRAIKGQSQNPEIALGAFLAQYGEDALRDLVDRVQSGEMDDTAARSEGKLRGAGDGMDDLIPASIEGEQDVLLSDGEFVVPADVVSGLGNGSSDAGARALEEMMDRVRTARNGTAEQPPQVPQERMLPA